MKKSRKKYFLPVIVILVLLMFFMNKSKRTIDAPQVHLTEGEDNDCVTERIIDYQKEQIETYEVRYSMKNNRTSLYKIIDKESGQVEEIMKLRNHYTNPFKEVMYKDYSLVGSVEIELFADESGFVYRGSQDKLIGFIAYVISMGKLLYTCETPNYYEFYIENVENVLMRGLLVYGEREEGILIYSECNEGVGDIVVTDKYTQVN